MKENKRVLANEETKGKQECSKCSQTACKREGKFCAISEAFSFSCISEAFITQRCIPICS